MAAVKLGRPRRVEDDAVFVAMIDVLLRVGWPRVTLALIAREVGVTPAALRQRFGGKHELLVAFYAWGTELVRANLAAADGPEPPLAALRAMVRAAVEPFSTPAQMVNAMSAFTEVATEPDLRELAAERVTLTLNKLESVLRRAIACGELASADAAQLAQQLHACMIGECLAWSLSGQGSLYEQVQAMVDQVLAPYMREPRPNGAAVCS